MLGVPPFCAKFFLAEGEEKSIVGVQKGAEDRTETEAESKRDVGEGVRDNTC